MDDTKQALIDRFTRVADRMSARMRRAAIQDSMQDWSEMDLTMPQLRTLGLLAHTSRRMGEVASYLGSSVSSATSLIERLEGKALVERVHNPVDRRVVMCHLTPGGHELMERFWRMQRLKVEQIAGVLSEDELAQVVKAMEIMADAFERAATAEDEQLAMANACTAPTRDTEEDITVSVS